MQCDPIAGNDTVAMNELLDGLVESTKELQEEIQSLVVSVLKVEKLFAEDDQSEPPSELEILLRMRVRMLLAYVTLLQVGV